MPLERLASPQALRRYVRAAKQANKQVVLVPTMGALHEGHLQLVDLAKKRGDVVITSVFVNPTQFGANEDLSRYPRQLEQDAAALQEKGCHALFMPTSEDVYPEHFNTYVAPTNLASVMCGASRPNHFRGVCTVVLILFRMCECDAAVFGKKDYQQLQIIKQMNRDLWLDVDIIEAEIVRAADGLALSSRNRYLSQSERQAALSLKRALNAIYESFNSGTLECQPLIELGKAQLSPGVALEYLDIRDAHSLQELTSVKNDAVCAIAAKVGQTRLIDNVLI